MKIKTLQKIGLAFGVGVILILIILIILEFI